MKTNSRGQSEEEYKMDEIHNNLEDTTGDFPPALEKAFDDQPWDYMLGLRDGRTIRFGGARLCKGGKWVTLLEFNGTTQISGVDHRFPRGIDVRISDIMWVTDAPDGS
jgi:hypothetical protein